MKSPTGKYILLNVDADESREAEWLGNSHALFLLALEGDVQAVKLLAYGRSVSVAWSPDGNRIALSNRHSSSDSDCFVYTVKTSIRGLDVETTRVGDHLREFIGESFENLGHRYVDVVEWLANDTIAIRAWGYGDLAKGSTTEFDRVYRYDMKGGIEEISKESLNTEFSEEQEE